MSEPLRLPPEKLAKAEATLLDFVRGSASAAFGAVVLAAGGRVVLEPGVISDFMDKNMELSVERHGNGFLVRAYARPRCEKCGRWERHE